jgi:hypothetical protein
MNGPDRLTLGLSLLLLLSAAGRAEPAPAGGFAPVLQYGAGALAGTAGAFVGGFLGIAAENCREDPEDDFDFCGLGGLLLGGGLGYIAGNTLGVSLVGKGLYGRSHWAATLAGSVLGSAAALAIASQVPSINAFLFGDEQLYTFAALVPAFTTVGYHAGRRFHLRAGVRGDAASLRIQTSF